ncbi:MAG: hypothetical protein KGJ35_01790 [Patescibacteria group bacterium]|nr:hypothetical protein [Patescibacteria group bacterium]
MPNMFGGDQMHPAYAPWSEPKKKSPRRILIGNTFYEIKGSGKKMIVRVERVDGSSSLFAGDDEYLPAQVKRKITLLRNKRKVPDLARSRV